MVKCRVPQRWRGVCGGVFESLGLQVEAGGFALDGDLDRVAAAVQEPLEGGDERFLFGWAAQLEARSLGVEEEAVTFVCELHNAASQDAADRDVERRDPQLLGASG